MSLLDRYHRQAVLLGEREHYNESQVLADIRELADLTARPWKPAMRAITGPVMASGGFAGLEAAPAPDALAAVTGSVAEMGLWATASYTPIGGGGAPVGGRSPVAYELQAAGTITTVAAPGTWVLTPRIGTSSGGGTLGASAAMTLTASITAAVWQLQGRVTVRGTGTGTNGRAYGNFLLIAKLVTAANGAADQHQMFGVTAATFDSTAAQGLFIGSTVGATTVSITPQQVWWESKN